MVSFFISFIYLMNIPNKINQNALPDIKLSVKSQKLHKIAENACKIKKISYFCTR